VLCCSSDPVSSFPLGGGLVAAALRRWALHCGGFLGVVVQPLCSLSALDHVECFNGCNYVVDGQELQECFIFISVIVYRVATILMVQCNRAVSVVECNPC
jgi:hypothetical protein